MTRGKQLGCLRTQRTRLYQLILRRAAALPFSDDPEEGIYYLESCIRDLKKVHRKIRRREARV